MIPYRAIASHVMLALTSSCSTYLHELTPDAAHQNFVRNLDSYIGEDINANKGWIRKELQLSQQTLATGTTRYRFGVAGGCIKVFDVDSRSNKIAAVGFEGTERQCALR